MAFRFCNKVMECWLFIGLFILCGCVKKEKRTDDYQIRWASEWDGNHLDEFLRKYKPFSYSDKRPFVITQKEFYSLSEEEGHLAVEVLKKFFDDSEHNGFSSLIQKPFPLREYFRQYIGYQKDGHVMVYVNLYTHIPYRNDPNCLCIYMMDTSKTIINEEYGGTHYGTAIINLTEKRVESFLLNKEAK